MEVSQAECMRALSRWGMGHLAWTDLAGTREAWRSGMVRQRGEALETSLTEGEFSSPLLWWLSTEESLSSGMGNFRFLPEFLFFFFCFSRWKRCISSLFLAGVCSFYSLLWELGQVECSGAYPEISIFQPCLGKLQQQIYLPSRVYFFFLYLSAFLDRFVNPDD